MLAQNFKTAEELGITEPHYSALQKTLVLLETGKLTRVDDENYEYSNEGGSFSGHFNMDTWNLPHKCGTVACIGGTAELVGGLKTDELDYASNTNAPLHALFYPSKLGIKSWSQITPAQAAIALRCYLTTGDSRWDLAVTIGDRA